MLGTSRIVVSLFLCADAFFRFSGLACPPSLAGSDAKFAKLRRALPCISTSPFASASSRACVKYFSASVASLLSTWSAPPRLISCEQVPLLSSLPTLMS